MKLQEGLIQGSKEWHNYRRLHIGASESSIILGLNPWRTQKELWEEKVFGWEQKQNAAMKRGQDMEGMAKSSYEMVTGLIVNPVVAEHDLHNFISASFDGLTPDLKRGVEIKCGKSSHKLARLGEIPPYYLSQLQHQMFVADLKEIDYYSFDGKDGILIKALRDDRFIENMVDLYQEFWNCVVETKPPLESKYEATYPF